MMSDSPKFKFMNENQVSYLLLSDLFNYKFKPYFILYFDIIDTRATLSFYNLIHFHVCIFYIRYVIHHLKLWYIIQITIFWIYQVERECMPFQLLQHWRLNQSINKNFHYHKHPYLLYWYRRDTSKSKHVFLHLYVQFYSHINLYTHWRGFSLYNVSYFHFFSTHQYSTQPQLLKLDYIHEENMVINHYPIALVSFIFNFTLPNFRMAQQNLIYSLSIRSNSQKQNWFSVKYCII